MKKIVLHLLILISPLFAYPQVNEWTPEQQAEFQKQMEDFKVQLNKQMELLHDSLQQMQSQLKEGQGQSFDSLEWNAGIPEVPEMPAVPEMFGAGENYENLDRCLLADINSSNDMVQQKLLRGILYRENYTAELDVLLSKNTIQKVWIETALKDLI